MSRTELETQEAVMGHGTKSLSRYSRRPGCALGSGAEESRLTKEKLRPETEVSTSIWEGVFHEYAYDERSSPANDR